eukprot:scaffold15922_cov102-Skeletonema_marinoi.AAC.1
MGRYSLAIVPFTALDTIQWMKELAAIPNWTSSGYLRRFYLVAYYSLGLFAASDNVSKCSHGCVLN